MLTVIAINSSKRKMNTYRMIGQVQEILKDEKIKVEVINLFDYDIEPCIGCERCLLKGDCILKDDVSRLMDKLKLSDGILLTSPVYMENISGKLKVFLDRTCQWFHRPELYGKPILAMATTKGSGLKPTLSYLERVAIQWGAMNSGRIGRSIRNMDHGVSKDECKTFIRHLKMDKGLFKPPFKALTHFQVQKALAKKIGYLDKAYWQEKKWNQQVYYFDCKISPPKRLVARAFGGFLGWVMNKIDD